MNFIERGRTQYCSTRQPSSTTGGLRLECLPNVIPVCLTVLRFSGAARTRHRSELATLPRAASAAGASHAARRRSCSTATRAPAMSRLTATLESRSTAAMARSEARVPQRKCSTTGWAMMSPGSSAMKPVTHGAGPRASDATCHVTAPTSPATCRQATTTSMRRIHMSCGVPSAFQPRRLMIASAAAGCKRGLGCGGIPRENDANPYAAVVRIRLNAIPPEHSAMKIPVLMTPAAQATVHAGPEIGAAIRRHGVQVVGAHVLTPFPGVA